MTTKQKQKLADIEMFVLDLEGNISVSEISKTGSNHVHPLNQKLPKDLRFDNPSGGEVGLIALMHQELGSVVFINVYGHRCLFLAEQMSEEQKSFLCDFAEECYEQNLEISEILVPYCNNSVQGKLLDKKELLELIKNDEPNPITLSKTID